MARDEVSSRCDSKPIGEIFQFARVVEPKGDSEPARDRCGGIARAHEICGVDVGEVGVLQDFGQQPGALVSGFRERRVSGSVQFFGVANKIDDRGFLLDLTVHGRRAEAGGEKEHARADASGEPEKHAGPTAGRWPDGSMSRSHGPDLLEGDGAQTNFGPSRVVNK